MGNGRLGRAIRHNSRDLTCGREQVAKANVRYRARRRQGRAAADSGAVRVMSSLMTESVIDHAGPAEPVL
jgi:hypothetical protein